MGELKRVLGMPSVLLITINSIIGTGIFFLPALGASYSGPSSIIAWVILASIAVYTSACFGELVSMFPYAGGIYEFSKQAYGRFTSFIIGWIAWLVGNVTTAMLVVGGIQYLLPVQGTSATFVKLFISIFWVISFNFMAYRGMKTSSFMLMTFSLITIFLLTILIFAALFNIKSVNYSPFFIHKGVWINFSYIFLTIFFISETFFGLETVTFLSEETKDPTKILPRALVSANVIIGVLSILLVVTSLGAINYKVFSSSIAPFALLGSITFGTLGHDLITLGTYLVIMGAAAGWVVAGPRLILALTRDKLFIPKFNKIHKEYGTPHVAITFQAMITITFIVLAYFGEGYKTLLSLLVPMVLVMMSFAILALPILRLKKPDLDRPFKVSFPIVGPIFVAMFHISLIIVWVLVERSSINLSFLLLSLIFLGLPVYFLLELYYQPRTIQRVNNAIAYLSYWLEGLTVSQLVKARIFHFIGEVYGKRVLDLGCSVGTISVILSRSVGKTGFVFAVESSEKNVDITNKRLKALGNFNYLVIKDEEEYIRLHPKVRHLDAVVSVGLISYLQDVQGVLNGINKRLSVGGKAVFVDYDKLFDVIPSIDWIENDGVIVKYFAEAGFNVMVERKQGFAWGYVFLYAEKVKEV